MRGGPVPVGIAEGGKIRPSGPAVGMRLPLLPILMVAGDALDHSAQVAQGVPIQRVNGLGRPGVL